MKELLERYENLDKLYHELKNYVYDYFNGNSISFEDIKYDKILTYSLGIVGLSNKEVKAFIPSTFIDPYIFINA